MKLGNFITKLEKIRKKHGDDIKVLIYENEVGPEGYVVSDVLSCNDNEAVLIIADGSFESGPGVPVKIKKLNKTKQYKTS